MHSPSLMLGADFLPINLIELVGVSMSMLFLLMIATGFAIRFSAKPLVEALSKLGVGNLFDPARLLNEGGSRLANRVTELEQEVAKLKGMPVRMLPAQVEPKSRPVQVKHALAHVETHSAVNSSHLEPRTTLPRA